MSAFAHLLADTAPPPVVMPDALEAELSQFRAEWETARCWGRNNTAILSPMDPSTANRARDMAFEYYYAPYPHADLKVIKRLYRDTVDAIDVAVIRKTGKARFSHKIRAALVGRDGDSCWLCSEPLGDDMTIEHKVPRANGGTWAMHNLALAHRDCNRLMGRAGLAVKEAARAELACAPQSTQEERT